MPRKTFPLTIRSHPNGILVKVPADSDAHSTFGRAFTVAQRQDGGVYLLPDDWCDRVKRWADKLHWPVLDDRTAPDHPMTPESEWPFARECANCHAPVAWGDPGRYCPRCGIARSGANVLSVRRKETDIIPRAECPNGHEQTAREPFCRTCGARMLDDTRRRPLLDQGTRTPGEPAPLGDLATVVRSLDRLRVEGAPSDAEWRRYRAFWATVPQHADRPSIEEWLYPEPVSTWDEWVARLDQWQAELEGSESIAQSDTTQADVVEETNRRIIGVLQGRPGVTLPEQPPRQPDPERAAELDHMARCAQAAVRHEPAPKREETTYVCDGCMSRVTRRDVGTIADGEHVLCRSCTDRETGKAEPEPVKLCAYHESRRYNGLACLDGCTGPSGDGCARVAFDAEHPRRPADVPRRLAHRDVQNVNLPDDEPDYCNTASPDAPIHDYVPDDPFEYPEVEPPEPDENDPWDPRLPADDPWAINPTKEAKP